MNIVHVIGSYDPAKGGPQAVVVRLAAAQAALGHEVTIVSYSDDEVSRRAVAATAAIPGFDRVRTLLLPMPDLRETLSGSAAAKAMEALLRATDFVHLHGVWETNLLRASMLCRRFSVPYCVCCCGMLDVWSMQQSAWKKKLAMRLGFRRMLDGAAFIHALNADEIELMRPLGLKAPPVIIPNGIFLNEVEGGEADGGSLPRRPYVLFLSRLHYKKGLDILADAFRRVAPLFPDVDLVVAGPDGGAEDEFRERIRQYGLQERVHMTGGLYGPAKIAALKRAACFCLPSRQEGFSVAITEALACGVPVAITDACHFPEVGEAGAGIVSPLDPMAVAAALERILEDPDRAARMGVAGAKLVRDNYIWPRIAVQTIAAYQDFQSQKPDAVASRKALRSVTAS
ncbi:glycosyltransferase involved in cell wall biosynthesis [Ochrobactrum intermedium]|uniref:Glycosyltransferase involved in cell wall biosynthesis n=1 Tax=Brucella intermedia TaxID=94625 RepID=A0ABR6AMD4_9HYPH|nr:glycosyltransferase [Brucella intermedia]KAB2711013.1 glycosyltransferase [Brucella intermedia]MBA8850615.1 glycosyltransferase involved in cell wall biosynthesis [Brucella intermedia]NYD81798.1 glycosyltransferase involved in cell wall biosynthesis [Brucella intermedia]